MTRPVLKRGDLVRYSKKHGKTNEVFIVVRLWSPLIDKRKLLHRHDFSLASSERWIEVTIRRTSDKQIFTVRREELYRISGHRRNIVKSTSTPTHTRLNVCHHLAA